MADSYVVSIRHSSDRICDTDRSLLFFYFLFFLFLVAEAKRQLVAAGFHLLNEDEEWDLKPGGCYFFTRNMSCLVAFSIGEK